MSRLVCFLILISVGINAQHNKNKQYLLLDKYKDSDFNYPMIDSINSMPGSPGYLMKTAFRPIRGNYTVYRFLDHDYGMLFDGYESPLNNLIILKVDNSGIIVDGYKYLLQNAQRPMFCDLYQISEKGQKMSHLVAIQKLKFKNIGSSMIFDNQALCDEKTAYLKDFRTLKLPKHVKTSTYWWEDRSSSVEEEIEKHLNRP